MNDFHVVFSPLQTTPKLYTPLILLCFSLSHYPVFILIFPFYPILSSLSVFFPHFSFFSALPISSPILPTITNPMSSALELPLSIFTTRLCQVSIIALYIYIYIYTAVTKEIGRTFVFSSLIKICSMINLYKYHIQHS